MMILIQQMEQTIDQIIMMKQTANVEIVIYKSNPTKRLHNLHMHPREQQQKFPKSVQQQPLPSTLTLTPSITPINQNAQSQLVQKYLKISIQKSSLSNTSQIVDFHFAIAGTFVCVDLDQSKNNTKRVLHFGLDGKLIAELPIKEDNYVLWMLSDSYVNYFQYSDKKAQGHMVQWNLLTHETIIANLNRQILPNIKVFSFSESQTFCICQYDHNMQPQQSPCISQKSPAQTGKYHTKYKLSYYKFPLRKSHPKPQVVFKTHTNPKQYGYHQQILKLNDHSMIGSLSNKLNQNDQTMLKTFDFRANPMGVQINYKLKVQINYRRELLQLWVTDMWELRPENLYLKCQVRVDRGKEEKYLAAKNNNGGNNGNNTMNVNNNSKNSNNNNNVDNKQLSQAQSLEQCIHLTWAYKNENTIKYAKFKTPILNCIQFLNGFNKKQRVRDTYQKILNKQKVSTTTAVTIPTIVKNDPMISSSISTTSMVSNCTTTSGQYNQNFMGYSQAPNVYINNQKIEQPHYIPQHQYSTQSKTDNHPALIGQPTSHHHQSHHQPQHHSQTGLQMPIPTFPVPSQHQHQPHQVTSPNSNTNLSNNTNINNITAITDTYTYTKSSIPLPIYYIRNPTQQILFIDQSRYSQYQVTYPAYYPTMIIYSKISMNTNTNTPAHLQLILQKTKQSYNYKEMLAYLLASLGSTSGWELQSELMRSSIGLLTAGYEGNSGNSININNKCKELEIGWNIMEGKGTREIKSRSNYQGK